MAQVKVWLPFCVGVPYTVEVDDPWDVEAVRRELLKKDASDWDYDPEFYENLGSNFEYYVGKVTLGDIEIPGSSFRRQDD